MGEVVHFNDLLDYSEDELAEVSGLSILALPGSGSVGHLAHVYIYLLRSALHWCLLHLLSLCFLRFDVLQTQDGVSLPAATYGLLLFGISHKGGMIQRRFNIKWHEEIRPIFDITILKPWSSAHCLLQQEIILQKDHKQTLHSYRINKGVEISKQNVQIVRYLQGRRSSLFIFFEAWIKYHQMIIMKEQQPIESSKQLRALQNYKRRLLVETLVLFFICFLFLVERVFYQMIVHAETDLLHEFQVANHLVTEEDTGTLPSDIQGSFFQLYAQFSRFQIQFLLVTHLLLTLYVTFDSKIAAKVLTSTFGIIMIVTFFQLLYQGARPFWTSDGVKSSACLRNYNHPDLGSILLIFLPAYTYYCWRQKNRSLVDSPHNKCNNFGVLVVAALTLLVFFLNYVTGTVFIFNVCFSSLFAIVFFIVLTFLNNKMDQSLKLLLHRKTSQSSEVKWLFFVLFSVLFVLMTYSATTTFQDTEWIRNYMSCKSDLSQPQDLVSYDRIVGSWFTFTQAAVGLAWIGAALGLSHCYSVMRSRQWCKGTVRMRLANFIAANAMLVPSWVFEVVLKDQAWIADLGLNSFIVDGIHYFVLYLWLFGFMPPLVLERLLGTTETLNYDDSQASESKR